MVSSQKSVEPAAMAGDECAFPGNATLSEALSLPLGSDEVYLLGLPWEPWLAYDSGQAMFADTAFVLPLAAAARRCYERVRQHVRDLAVRVGG